MAKDATRIQAMAVIWAAVYQKCFLKSNLTPP